VTPLVNLHPAQAGDRVVTPDGTGRVTEYYRPTCWYTVHLDGGVVLPFDASDVSLIARAGQ
jgi:hypothetical protein